MTRSFLHPRYRSALPDMWPSRVTFRLKKTRASAMNQPVRDDTTAVDDVPGMSNLECRLVQLIRQEPMADVKKTQSTTTIYGPVEILVNKYVSDRINEADHLAIVDGVEYQIRSVEADSQFSRSRLRIEIIT